jgi:hypothetical protein
LTLVIDEHSRAVRYLTCLRWCDVYVVWVMELLLHDRRSF